MTDSAASPEPIDPLAGRYRLDEIIATGGAGRVWFGTDDYLARDLAIKEVRRPRGARDAVWSELRTQIQWQVNGAAALSHPSIVPVYDVIDAHGRLWIVTQRVRAVSLAGLVAREGPLAPQRVTRLGLQLAEALAEAHSNKVVHHGIKPSDVLVTPSPERAILTDFGIGVLNQDATLARTGVLVGTPAFLAPESARGESAGAASDLWSLGATLYFALSGRPPFPEANGLATLSAIVTDQVPSLPSAGPLQAVLDGLLHKEPTQRMSSAEVVEVLRSVAKWSSWGTAEDDLDPDREAEDEAGQLAGGTGPIEPEVETVLAAEPAPDPAGSSRAAVDPVDEIVAAANERQRSVRVPPILVLGAVAVVFLAFLFGGRLFGPGETSTEGGVPGSPDIAGNGPQPSPDDPSASPSPAPDASAGAPDAPGGDPGDDLDIPMREYVDDSGYSLHVPAHWAEIHEGDSVYFENPDGGYLQVDQTLHPGADARQGWVALENRVADTFPHYQRVSIESLYHPALTEFSSAADWEFTYHSPEYGSIRVVNRGFLDDRRGYAILLNGPEPQWDSTNRDLLDAVTRSFEPPRP